MLYSKGAWSIMTRFFGCIKIRCMLWLWVEQEGADPDEYLDFARVFDSVSHRLLLVQLYTYPTRSDLLACIKSSLSDDSHVLRLNNVRIRFFSSWSPSLRYWLYLRLWRQDHLGSLELCMLRNALNLEWHWAEEWDVPINLNLFLKMNIWCSVSPRLF